ncbi:hypothetical protein CASFOL_020938 [Castilleja foliolosa]|uniref:Uncharacterized protein n=1 Tax=Castilleja foliolosa TaxID=1961234 RepID=A0ABD3D4D6_9LAMI
MGVSEKLGGDHVVDSEKWVFSEIALRAPLKPIFTKKALEKNEEDECATTPTSSESRIPSRLICPLAPKKRKSSSSSSSKSCRVIEFFNPPDLESIFVRRVV